MIPALRRVERNDPTLTHLLMCEPPTVIRREGQKPSFDMARISDDRSSLKALCDSIGDNSHLEDVCFDAPFGLTDSIADAACFEGLRRNTSIGSLGLSRCELSHGLGREVLRALEEKHGHLLKFAMWRCGMRLGGTSNLASSLTNCRHLEEISLSSCGMDDASVREIVAAVRGHHQLNSLDLRDNNIGKDGCKDLSVLLHKPNCNQLRIIELGDNKIDDDGAAFIADGLRVNDTLKAVGLCKNAIRGKGWNAISNAICDTSSLNATHSSNHTLLTVASFGAYDEDDVVPHDLLRLLELNSGGRDRGAVARRKVLRRHFVDAFRMEPFLDENMSRKVLPHVARWIGRSRDREGLTATLNLLREMPALLSAPGPSGGGDLSPARRGRRVVSTLRKNRLEVVIIPRF